MRIKLAFVVLAAVTVGLQAGGVVAAGSPSLVGRWQVVRTCQGIVDALNRAGLGPIAPGVVGDYFPGQSAAELATKKSVCKGAKPQLHGHFFTARGQFGSLDQHGGQVDDAQYRVSGSTVTIGEGQDSGRFRFRVRGNTLLLTPLLTASQKREALAHPLEFSVAGWMVAVAYTGHPWKRVACRGWC